jgi:hypothetical protein
MTLFVLGFLPARLLLVYLAKQYANSKHVAQLLGIAAGLIAIGFWTIYLTNSRQTGAEVFGQKIWWNRLRPLHGTLYAIFSAMILSGNTQLQTNAWKILLLDWFIGLFAFLSHHF